MKISSLCFDLSSNAFGRAWLLAQAAFWSCMMSRLLGPPERGGNMGSNGDKSRDSCKRILDGNDILLFILVLKKIF